MPLPAAGYISNASRTVAEQKTALEDLRDFVADLPGGAPRQALTIASGAVVPGDGTSGGVIVVDTEAAAATDDLTTITTTNTPDGRLLLVYSANASRVVTIKHNAGGTGQIQLKDAADFVLDALDKWVLLQLRSTTWVEIERGYGIDYPGLQDHMRLAAVPAHNLLCPHTRLVIQYATAATLNLTADAVVLADASGRLKRFNSLSETLTLSSTGANGRDVADNGGAEQASAWYHLFAIGKTDGTLDVFASQVGFPGSGTSIYTRLPAGYAWAGYLGAARNDASSNLVTFFQRGHRVMISSAAALSGGTQTVLTSIDLSSRVPVTAQAVRYDLYVLGSTTGDKSCAIYSTTTGYLVAQYLGDSGSSSGVDFRWTDTVPLHVAQTLAYLVNSANVAATMTTLGYEF
jgi:hypothetical protein